MKAGGASDRAGGCKGGGTGNEALRQEAIMPFPMSHLEEHPGKDGGMQQQVLE